ncbi:MAG: KH domain-containing protein [Candidatus Micrarchaeaceae archaeon]
MQHLLIPKERVKLLTGKALAELERKLECRIKISDENSVMLEGSEYNEFNAKNVITAFGRGFDIKSACKLLSDDVFLKIVNLKDLFKNDDRIRVIKGRVIGKGGKSKKYIESVSGTEICVYGNTISIIGTPDEINIAAKGIELLLEGAPHSKAYAVIEQMRKKLKMRV